MKEPHDQAMRARKEPPMKHIHELVEELRSELQSEEQLVLPACGDVDGPIEAEIVEDTPGTGSDNWVWEDGDKYGWGHYFNQCFHQLDTVVLGDSEEIFFASERLYGNDKNKRAFTPYMGVYLMSGWSPRSATVSVFLDWPDMSVPRMELEELEAIAWQMIDASRSGRSVEVACFGSHGRTGTMLAIVDLLLSENPDANVSMARVRANHCSKAIETLSQEWLIKAFAAYLTGAPVPAKPRITKVSSFDKMAWGTSLPTGEVKVPTDVKKEAAKAVAAPAKSNRKKNRNRRRNNGGRKDRR